MRHFISAKLMGLLALLIVFEHFLSPFLFSLGARLDLIYLLVLDYAFFWSWERAAFFALFVGLILDLFGGHLFGIQTITLTVMSLLLSLGIQKLERDLFWVKMMMTILFVALTETLGIILGLALETSSSFSWNFLGTVIRTTFYTALIAPVFYWFTEHWFKRSTAFRQYELFR